VGVLFDLQGFAGYVILKQNREKWEIYFFLNNEGGKPK
jgi:hypothetical protein